MPFEPILGQIMPFAGEKVPRGWAVCNGALLPISTYSALFSLLGTYYGGNGINNFALPDLRGRAILGVDNRNQYPPGTIGGEVSVTLTTAQIPSHTHGVQASTNTGAGRGDVPPTGHLFGKNTLPATGPTKIFVAAGTSETPLAIATNVATEGNSAAHNNMQPYLVINYLIALQGIYPSRS